MNTHSYETAFLPAKTSSDACIYACGAHSSSCLPTIPFGSVSICNQHAPAPPSAAAPPPPDCSMCPSPPLCRCMSFCASSTWPTGAAPRTTLCACSSRCSSRCSTAPPTTSAAKCPARPRSAISRTWYVPEGSATPISRRRYLGFGNLGLGFGLRPKSPVPCTLLGGHHVQQLQLPGHDQPDECDGRHRIRAHRLLQGARGINVRGGRRREFVRIHTKGAGLWSGRRIEILSLTRLLVNVSPPSVEPQCLRLPAY